MYEKIKEKLDKRKEELQALVNKVETSARRKLDKDFEEQAIERQNEEVLTALDNSLNEELEQIHEALYRIEKNMYGKCANCGAEIGEKRLLAVPHTSLCINCAE
ncbi:MAG: TraR/DksA family transcriptional regulator [Acidobacteria bacterium]|nr:MAG: TraR/DksA family transcriptional regulator [Acidobacteriota bacterium]REK02788.1 MAG: TraR/DksA family transcriptional regulator [Acidobacteriota bacterium]REK13407.1 MAG: TraR/DksA family transcriptional regulator [Acidobacteriota bacterium]REK41401.1 MAG: TraR/DksA family transcriptional regulator [Acidobacteriota bacterium]